MRALLLLSILLMVGCEFRPITFNYDSKCNVAFEVDWSEMSESPSGMTIMCYPTSGDNVVVLQTNSTSQTTVSLSQGEYNVVIFNRTIGEFSSLRFTGLDSFDTFELYTDITESKWAVSKGESELVSTPEEFAVATYLGLTITGDCIEKSQENYASTGTRLTVDTITTRPQVVVKECKVNVKVEGYENLRSVRATLMGMAGGYRVSSQLSTSTQVTHLLETWSGNYIDSTNNIGEVSATLLCFGLPGTETTTRADSTWSGELDMQMLLVDNETIIYHTAPLDTTRLTSDSDSYDITISSGYSDDENDPTVELPYVEPEGSDDELFDTTIDGWENLITVDIDF